MIQKKVCLLGAFAVGKTSLVERCLRDAFSGRPEFTVGVGINRKEFRVENRDVNLVIWDLHGEDEFEEIRMSYLRGAAGYLLVADGTRSATLDRVLSMIEAAVPGVDRSRLVLALNKSDLTAEWQIRPDRTRKLQGQGWSVMKTSAKTGEGVTEAFEALARKMAAGA